MYCVLFPKCFDLIYNFWFFFYSCIVVTGSHCSSKSVRATVLNEFHYFSANVLNRILQNKHFRLTRKDAVTNDIDWVAFGECVVSTIKTKLCRGSRYLTYSKVTDGVLIHNSQCTHGLAVVLTNRLELPRCRDSKVSIRSSGDFCHKIE